MNIAPKANKQFGIITCSINRQPPFCERQYYEQLTRIGKTLGIAVIVFDPKDVDWKTRRVSGYTYLPEKNEWSLSQQSIPAVIYDRCFYLNTKHYLAYKPFVQQLSRAPRVKLLGVPLKGKWPLAQFIARSPKLSAYFPPTRLYKGGDDITAMLATYGSVVAKPNGGSHGRGVVAIFRENLKGPCRVIGRSNKNRHFSRTFTTTKQTIDWLQKLIGNRRYVLQPYLHLTTPDGSPFDIRLLVQKNMNGMWQTTGMAVRIGAPRTLTSNLHGGGKAEKIGPFLKQLPFDSQKKQTILRNIDHICTELPPSIERQHGRLCELGIDIGIDRNGRVWLLEVNSKPGRQVFRLAGEHKQYVTAIRRPLLYAATLLHGL